MTDSLDERELLPVEVRDDLEDGLGAARPPAPAPEPLTEPVDLPRIAAAVRKDLARLLSRP